MKPGRPLELRTRNAQKKANAEAAETGAQRVAGHSFPLKLIFTLISAHKQPETMLNSAGKLRDVLRDRVRRFLRLQRSPFHWRDDASLTLLPLMARHHSDTGAISRISHIPSMWMTPPFWMTRLNARAPGTRERGCPVCPTPVRQPSSFRTSRCTRRGARGPRRSP